VIPAGGWTHRSLYLKVRDRQSYEYAVASAAVVLGLDGEVVTQARIALP
jgi:xanthine dehydrogenase YagS FAD-binding subunit